MAEDVKYLVAGIPAVAMDDPRSRLPVFVLKAALSKWGASRGYSTGPGRSAIAALMRQAGYEVVKGRSVLVVKGLSLRPEWRDS